MDSFTFHWAGSARWALSIGLVLCTSVMFAHETPSTAVPKLSYRSVFSQYQGFTEQPVVPWRESNEVVEKMGGWRGYAKEAMLPDTDEKAAATPDPAEMHGEHGSKP